MPKDTSSRIKKLIKGRQGKPLHTEYLENEEGEENNKQRKALQRIQKRALGKKVNIIGDDYKADDIDEEVDEDFLDAKTTQRIENVVKKQQAEFDMDDDDEEQVSSILEVLTSTTTTKSNKKKSVPEYVEIQLEEEDENALNFFLGDKEDDEHGEPINISDVILQKIKEKEQSQEAKTDPTLVSSLQFDEKALEEKLHKKVVASYRALGTILKKYRSGKLPKVFAIIPTLSNWEEILYLTQPDKWSTQAVYKATKLFVSQGNDFITQRFLNMILLPRVRNDILTSNKKKSGPNSHFVSRKQLKLNHHLYQSIIKATWRPAALFKGFIIPLCEDGQCTVKEAHIIGGILKKMTIPVMHSAAALLKIASLNYSNTNCMFIKVFLDKRYVLPTQVVQGVVSYFTRFLNISPEASNIHNIWYQTLLTFAIYYGSKLSKEQKQQLKQVCKTHKQNSAMSVEIVKALNNPTGILPQHKSKYPSKEGSMQVDEDGQ
ncbi:hypothetical protein C9374_006912 [Naegleria lovaniensis]|uniref:Bystin n=1 Tax=Naegleria lovaniensis TaxID=51637 RepID=A0AA88KRK8_NAELO|nr:uncharacterized protein C9374_006912 [Naegleria lovaniensis]KAG2393381.1 hypothetical protein C9374_006912 [Naegleria lovaniensis]